MCEKHSWHSQCVYHCNQISPLLEPVLAGPTQRISKVQDPVCKVLTLASYHVFQFIKSEFAIFRVFPDIDPASLKSTPSHFGIECKVSKARMFGKLAISTHHKVLKVISSSDCARAGVNKVTSTCRKQSWKCACDISFRLKLVDWSISTLWPWYSFLLKVEDRCSTLFLMVSRSVIFWATIGTNVATSRGSTSSSSAINFNSSSISVLVSSILIPHCSVKSNDKKVLSFPIQKDNNHVTYHHHLVTDLML